jgi:GT2 family glycosyltransferase
VPVIFQEGISVVIPNYNGRALLEKNVPILLNDIGSYGLPYEIIISDDASSDDSVAFVKKKFQQVILICSKKNRGFSTTVNNGAFSARFNYLLLLNSDIRVTSGFLLPMLAYFKKPDTFAVSNMTMDQKGDNLIRTHIMEFHWGIFRERYFDDSGLSSFAFGASGGHALFDTRKFIELGGFCELFNPFYYEDSDLGYRAWKRGYRIYFEPASKVYHDHQGSIGKLNASFVKTISYRNRFLFYWKNLTDLDLITLHFLLLPAYLIVNTIRDPWFGLGFIKAAAMVGSALRERKKESFFNVRSDKEVLGELKKNIQ